MTSGRNSLFNKKAKKASDAIVRDNEPLQEDRPFLSRKLSFQGTSGTVFDSGDIEEQIQAELGTETTILTLFEMHGVHESEIPSEFERIPEGRARIRVAYYKEELVAKSAKNSGGQRVILVAVDRQQTEDQDESGEGDAEREAEREAGVIFEGKLRFSTEFYGRMAELETLDNEKLFELAFRQVAAYIRTLPAEGKGHSVRISLRELDSKKDFAFLVMLAACCIHKLGTFSVEGDEALTGRLQIAVTKSFPSMDVFNALEASVTADVYHKVEARTDSLLDVVSSGLTAKGVIGQTVSLETILSSATASDANTSATSTVAAVEVTPWTVIPVISQFLRGAVSFHEAWRAYRDKNDPDRKVKMGTALFSGLVSFGSGIVSSLYLGHVGLLATAAALTLTPIVLTSIAVGVYLVVLLRDLYLLQSLNQRIAAMGEPQALDNATRRKLQKLETSRNDLRSKMKTDVLLMIGVSLTLAALVVGTVMTGGVLPLALSIVGGSLVASLVIVRVGEKAWHALRNSRLLSSLGRRSPSETNLLKPRPNSLSPPLAAMLAKDNVNSPNTDNPNQKVNLPRENPPGPLPPHPVSMPDETPIEREQHGEVPPPGNKRIK